MNTDEQAIRELINHWHSSTAKGDLDGLLKLMCENVIFLVPGQPPIRGRSHFLQSLRTLLLHHSIRSSGVIEEIEIDIDLAYCITLLSVEITNLSAGTTQCRSGYTLTIFQKQLDGTWLLKRDANLLLAPTNTL